MRAQLGDCLVARLVRNEPQIELRHRASRQDRLAAGPGVTADETFNVHGGLRGQAFERLRVRQVIDPVAHPVELLAGLLVPVARNCGDELLLTRGEWPDVLEPSVDRRRVAVGCHKRLQGLDEAPCGRRAPTTPAAGRARRS